MRKDGARADAYPAFRALTYLSQSENEEEEKKKKERLSLRDEVKKMLAQYHKGLKPWQGGPEDGDEDIVEADDDSGSFESKFVKQVQKILNCRGFFDDDGAMHIETLLLEHDNDLKNALREFHNGNGPYIRLRGLVRYRYLLIKKMSSKHGIPRRFLLGRRYNHSGRAVIVPEPSLPVHQVYLPVAMLTELLDGYDKEFKRGLGKALRNTAGLREIVNDIPRMEDKAREIAQELDNYLEGRPLWGFLVRQPSLHRHSVQAFQLRCWEHPVIGMPPLVTSGFNADFDGDTMAVFLPPYEQAKDLSHFSILNNPGLVGTGTPAFADGLDLALGGWVLGGGEISFADSLKECLCGVASSPFAEQSRALSQLQQDACTASTGAATLAPGDFEALCSALRHIPPEKDREKDAEAELAEALKADSDNGLALMLNSKAKGKTGDVLQMVWAIGKIEKMKDEDEGDENTSNMEADFIKGGFWRGLHEDELFRYSYPSRYSMAQKKLSVADAGYLSRQLAEGLYELTVTTENCGTQEGLRVACENRNPARPYLTVEGIPVPTLGDGEDTRKDLERIAWGRVPVGLDFCLDNGCLKFIERYWLNGDKTAKTHAQKLILKHLEENDGELILRSPLFCEEEGGCVCGLCCGADLAKKPYDNPEPLKEGYVGMSAAQAIGERGTQLAMKRFHDVSNVSQSPIQAIRRLLISYDFKKLISSAEEYRAGRNVKSLNEDEKRKLQELKKQDKRLFDDLNKKTPQARLIWALFNKVLFLEDKNDKEKFAANKELPQAMIHYELALTPLRRRNVGLDEAAGGDAAPFLSALGHESVRKVIDFEKPRNFEDDLSSIKSRLMWEGGKR